MGALEVAIAALALSAASGVASYIQQEKAAEKQERAQREAAEREAAILAQQAADEEARGKEEAQKIREHARRVKAAQEAALAGSGVKLFEGTASDILSETDKLSELDALAALKDSAARANLLRKRESNILATDYSVPRTSSLLATGLSLAANALSTYGQYKRQENLLKELKAGRNIFTVGSGGETKIY